jgi:hypothetical protein
MRTLVKFVLIAWLTLAASESLAGELVDRLVASVENVPILQSDWEHAVALEALEQGRTVASYTNEERRAVLDRLVDQQLLRLQMGDENIATAEEKDIAKQLGKIRASYPEGKTDEDWQRLLTRYGADEAMLRRKVAQQLQVMRFVDLRLRPESRVAREDVEAYYSGTLIPEIRQRGGKEESLAQVYPQVEEILRQQRMDTLLNNWIQELRDHSDIQWLAADVSGAAADVSAANAGGR